MIVLLLEVNINIEEINENANHILIFINFSNTQGYLPFDDPSIRVVLHKVKKGVFEMPPFPSDIQDLIKHLIVVDPKQRLTIDQIKAHPCFRRGLEVNYQLPRPIPDLSHEQPIDPTTLPQEIMKILTQIGFSDDKELNDELTSTENTMAKVFVSMLTVKLDFEKLPWDQSSKVTNSKSLDSNSFMFQSKKLMNNTDDPFHRHGEVRQMQQSLEMQSLATRPNWMCDDPDSTMVTSVLKVSTKCFYGKSIWLVMSRSQEAANDCGLQWFHPNPMIIYARTADGNFYVSITASYKEQDEIMINAKLHKGEENQFSDFTDRLYQAVDEPFVIG
ncbi:putative CAMK family protein kinase [Tritrichomonas foetus]|uniref:non-specific serine/threonine protein kinase n=1 Tax=Tritrichomonas foetus TaxID=1144522 RepID=A0A1J4K569_9EUKA|nr:putative CAMK family protein kinase [Tritrichomonas foetus]|eukprot:OHT06535.1 putative CAMK family protein kinase [Tritrichomonas foetus]